MGMHEGLEFPPHTVKRCAVRRGAAGFRQWFLRRGSNRRTTD